MQQQGKRGKILTVQDGYLVCPTCLRNHRLMKIEPDTKAERLRVYCRSCKTQHIVDIDEGQCFESQSR